MRRSVALLAVAALAACGGSGGERLSRDAYVAKADAICADVAVQREVLPGRAISRYREATCRVALRPKLQRPPASADIASPV